jgi:hypothetical protein
MGSLLFSPHSLRLPDSQSLSLWYLYFNLPPKNLI